MKKVDELKMIYLNNQDAIDSLTEQNRLLYQVIEKMEETIEKATTIRVSTKPDGYRSWVEALKDNAPLLFAEYSNNGIIKAGFNARMAIKKSLENNEELFKNLKVNGQPITAQDCEPTY